MAQQTITAFFDTRSDAVNAIEKLVDAGIARTSVRLLPEQEPSSGSSTSSLSYDYSRDEKGFWASLGELFMPDEDRAFYSEGMHRGGTTVVVTVDELHAERAADILEEHGSINLDEREAAWRNEGWTGYEALSSPAGTMGRASTDFGASADRTLKEDGTEAIPIVEEQLRVGKRQVAGGRVRVRSYVVETPVQEQVTLRDETVRVERRPVDRPLTDATEGFRDRTIEVEERDEEAVVSKEARVKEELVVRKDVEERTQTVSEKVRRTEVDIEDERATTAAKGTTGSSDPARRR